MILYKSLFLADDDADDRDFFMDALKEIDSNIHCFHASNGEIALQALLGDFLEKPDIIFLDINMPRVNGKDLLKMIKNSSSLANIPVIMYSTFLSPTDIEEIEKLGASHYIVKQTSFRLLCESLKSVLAQRW